MWLVVGTTKTLLFSQQQQRNTVMYVRLTQAARLRNLFVSDRW